MWSKDDAGRIRFRLSVIAAQSAVKKLLHYRNFGFNRIGNETLVVCAMMHLVQLLRGRLLLARPSNLRVQLHPRNRQSASRIFFHVADRFVGVVIEHKLLFTCDCEKGEHVTTGERGDERFLGIDVGRIAKISRSCRSRHGVAAVEAPGVIARIFLINKFGPAALPTQSYFVFGHVFRIRRSFRDRKQAEKLWPRDKLEGGGELCDAGLAGARPSTYRSGYLVRSAAVGGPSTQFTSHGPSTVMNVNEFAGIHASWTIFAGI